MAGTLSRTPQQIVSDDAATAFPSGTTAGWKVGGGRMVRTFVTYTGSVTSCVVRKLVRNKTTGVWHGDVSTAELDALTPARGSEVRVWDVDSGDEVSFQIESIAGGGTATVYADLLEG